MLFSYVPAEQSIGRLAAHSPRSGLLLQAADTIGTLERTVGIRSIVYGVDFYSVQKRQVLNSGALVDNNTD